MSRWNPCKRGSFIKKLRKLGFEGAYSGTEHQFMVYQNQRLTIPTNFEYSVPQLRMMLREVEEIIGRPVPHEEWNELA